MTSWIQIFLAAIVGIFACFHYYYSIRKALIDIKKAEPLDETIIGKFWRKYKSHISIIIGVISFAFLGFIYGRQNSIREKECKKRIVVLLPLSEENKAAYQDGVRQAIGVVDFIKSKPQLSDQFEVGIRDHKMDANAAELIIKDEIRNGTKYFICTMSNVCTQVSENFDKIVQEYNTEGEKPILISTVASSPKIQTLKNLKYRFYVRSQEEGKVLAEYADKMSFPSAYGIAISDAYGHGAIEEFKTYWTVNIFG